MTRVRLFLTFVLILLGLGRLCAADATFMMVLTDYQEGRDEKLVEAFEFYVFSPKDPGYVARVSNKNQIHDADKSTLTVEVKYAGLPEGEYEVWYSIPAIHATYRPYKGKFHLAADDHFRKKLELSTRKVLLKYQVDAKVWEHIREDESLKLTVTKLKDGLEKEWRSLEYRHALNVRRGGKEPGSLPLWLIPDGEYVVQFAPVWGRPMRIPFRVVDGKTIPEVVVFSDANRVRRNE